MFKVAVFVVFVVFGGRGWGVVVGGGGGEGVPEGRRNLVTFWGC